MANWLEGTVIENRHWTDTLYSIKVKVKDYPSFTAGQFTRIALKVGDELIARPYSLVNAPDEEYLEFYSILVEDGILSPPLNELQAGDSIYVSDLITGFLVLEEVPLHHKKMWLMATGTGIGPLLSILKTAETWERFTDVVLVHAVRLANELTYKEEIDKLLAQHKNMQYIPFVSREKTDFALPGRIPAALESGALEERAELKMDTSDTHIMLCGNPAMLKDVQGAMKARGFTRNRRRTPGHITTENYW